MVFHSFSCDIQYFLESFDMNYWKKLMLFGDNALRKIIAVY